MMGVLFALLAAPAPSPTPLKTISHVRTSPFCTAFNHNIRHGVEGVLINDRLFGKGSQLLRETGHDLSVGFDGWVQLDVSHIESVIGQVVHNLEVINAVLNSLPAADTSTQDGRILEQLRAQLLAAAKQQNYELNSLSGTAAQIELDQLHNVDVTLGGALAADKRQAIKDNGVLQGGSINKAANTEMKGMAVPIAALEVQSSREIAAQQGLAQTLIEASERCK